jgi:hypothetical protein
MTGCGMLLHFQPPEHSACASVYAAQALNASVEVYVFNGEQS